MGQTSKTDAESIARRFIHFCKDNNLFLFFLDRIKHPEAYRKKLIHKGYDYGHIRYKEGFEGLVERLEFTFYPETDILKSRQILPFEFEELPLPQDEVDRRWRSYLAENS